MTDKDYLETLDEAAANVLRTENRYYQEVTVTGVNGQCPFGHRQGDVFKVSTMNGDGICGSLLKSIFFHITALHYGGAVLWEPQPDSTTGCCPEAGKVQVAIRRRERDNSKLLKTPFEPVPMTGKGFAALDRYRLFVEVADIAVHCYWGHKTGDIFEVDPFNMGGACCFLYAQLYPYIHVLLAGASPPWGWDEHTVIGECPDTYDRLKYRLYIEKR